MNELLTSYEWSRRVVNEFGMRGEQDRRSSMNELLTSTEWSRASWHEGWTRREDSDEQVVDGRSMRQQGSDERVIEQG